MICPRITQEGDSRYAGWVTQRPQGVAICPLVMAYERVHAVKGKVSLMFSIDTLSIILYLN